MNDDLIITIDGPSGAGKSVLGQRVATALKYLYFDTGVLYRALTWLALNEGIDLDNEQALVELARRIPIEVRPPGVSDGRQYDVIADGKDITWLIRSADVDRSVSIVSAHPGVRQAMLNQQRVVAQQGAVVMVGRDTGTVVCPDADVKIYLDATLDIRAKRRYAERIARGDSVEYATVLEDLRRRDYVDSHRATAPLRAAPDAHLINTEYMSLDDEVETVLQLVQQHQDERGAAKQA